MRALSLASTPPHTPPSGKAKPNPSPITCSLGPQLPSPASRIAKTPVSQLKSAFRPSLSGCARSPVSPQVMVTDAPTSPSLESLAAWVSTNYMGMGKSAADALPELRRKGITASGNSFIMNGKPMAATEIAQALRLQIRPGSRQASPAKTPSASQASSSAQPTAPSPSSAVTSGLEGLAAYISANYMGMGKSAMDALPELRRKGITASGNNFVMSGQVMSAPEIASALRLQARPGSRPNSPVSASPRPARPSSAGRSAPFFGSQPPADISPPRPAVAASPSQGGLSSSMQAQAAGLRWLAGWIAANYTGMGRTEMDVLPELRRKNIVCNSVRGGQHFFRVPGHGTLDAARVAQALNLQARSGKKADSFASPPASPLRGPATPPNSPQAQLSRGISTHEDSSLDSLAAFIATNYMGLGKSAMDAKPELRRRGIVNAGQDMYIMGGTMMSAPDIASALRLQARTPSRPSTPLPSRAPSSPSSPPTSSAPAAAPAAPAPGTSGLEGLAAWISANYMGMGKSAADAMPELRRKGIAAVGDNSYSIAGKTMDAAGIAQALRLQARNPSRPITPPPSSSATSPAAPASFSAPSTPATPAASGLDGLAAFIATNYAGMGKSAMDVKPELRRKGITASGNNFVMRGQVMSAPEVASALRLQPRTPSRPSTPMPSRASASPPPAGSSTTAAAPAFAPAASAAAGLDGLAAFIATNYAGMGKSALDVLPELRRKGITASGNNFVMGGQLMDAAGIAQALRLQPRTPSRPSTPIPSRAPATPSAAPASYSAPAASPAAPTPAASASGLEGLAAYISANYIGMGKSAMDALPELRRKGITASGNSFVMNGQVMSAPKIASALRLQARTPSRFSTPQPTRPAPSAAPASFSTPAAAPSTPAPAASASGLEPLASWISANYMGMGKSAADAMPELRRKGITAVSNHSYSMAGKAMDAAGIAQALRLQARKSSSAPAPGPARPSSAPTIAAPTPAAKAADIKPSRPASSWDWAVKMTPERAMLGTRWLAGWLSANYIGVGKSEAEALPELRKKGIVCNAIRGGEHKFEVPGVPRDLSATEVAERLKLRPRSIPLASPL